MATYLDQRGIILIIDKHQIEAAHYHRWAEPLDQNIHRFLLDVLSSNSTNFSFQNYTKYSKQQHHMILNFEFDQFNGTSDGKVLVAGSWNLRDSKNNELILSDAFYYNQVMTESGYPELVNQLAKSLNEISLQLLNSISLIK